MVAAINPFIPKPQDVSTFVTPYSSEVEANRATYEQFALEFASTIEALDRFTVTPKLMDVPADRLLSTDDENILRTARQRIYDVFVSALHEHIKLVFIDADFTDAETLRRFYPELRLFADQRKLDRQAYARELEARENNQGCQTPN